MARHGSGIRHRRRRGERRQDDPRLLEQLPFAGSGTAVGAPASVGKEFAGRTVLVDRPEPGVWMIKSAQTIPDDELWLHQPEAASRLDRSLAAMGAAPEDTDLDALERHLGLR